MSPLFAAILADIAQAHACNMARLDALLQPRAVEPVVKASAA